MAAFDPDAAFRKLTTLDKIRLLTGLGWWHTEPVPEAGIPSLRFSDGPNGIRGTRFFNSVPSTCFPTPTGIGSSFDVELARKVGEALGDQARAKSCHVLLGPTVNIQRSPLGGRSFESFSEDPYLNGFIAAAYINGLQSKGVSATLKHYVANDQETERFSISSEVSERALREIYLKPFQIAIKHSNPWAVMTSYNRVNGTHVSDSNYLLDDILRKEWGFEGLVMSDWNGVYTTSASIKAGVDLEMPGPSVMRGKAVERALTAQNLFMSDIDARVRKILGLVKHAQQSGIPFDGPEEYVDSPETRALLRTAAADSIVLLKNDKGILPLSDNKFKTIAVIGPNAKYGVPSGGGSARLRSAYTISPLEGIRTAARDLGVDVVYSLGSSSYKCLPTIGRWSYQPNGDPGITMEFWNQSPALDFLSPTANLEASLELPIWTTGTHDSDCFLVDGVDPDKVSLCCWTRYAWTFIPDEDGDWEFELAIAGRGNLFLDGRLLIDLSTDPPLGGFIFGLGTKDVKRIAPGLKAGTQYSMELRISSEEFVKQSIPFACWGGIRLGAIRMVDPQVAIEEAVELARQSDVVVLVVGLNNDWESEGHDRDNLDLPGNLNELVSRILSANENVVVVNQSGSAVEMPWISEACTLLQTFYGGDELGNGLADVLFGTANPSAKLPLTFPAKVQDVPSYTSFGRSTEEAGKVFYNEGIFVGYRGYEVKGTKPLFAFGFGLSYTTFEYADLQISPIHADGSYKLTFKVTNTGTCEGKEIVQVYISDLESSLPRPVKELKAFTKVHIKAGESQQAEIKMSRESLGFYDSKSHHWIAEQGAFEILVGRSSEHLDLRGEITLHASITWTGL